MFSGKLGKAVTECKKREPTQDELDAVATAKASIKTGGSKSQKKAKELTRRGYIAVENDIGKQSMSLPSLKKYITASMGTDFSKTASKNRLKKALATAIEQGVIQKEGNSYLPSDDVVDEALTCEGWYIDLGDRGLIRDEYGPWWFYDKVRQSSSGNLVKTFGVFTCTIPITSELRCNRTL